MGFCSSLLGLLGLEQKGNVKDMLTVPLDGEVWKETQKQSVTIDKSVGQESEVEEHHSVLKDGLVSKKHKDNLNKGTTVSAKE